MVRALTTIAVIGAGLVGAGWTIVFAGAGRSVRVFDADPAIRAELPQAIMNSLRDMAGFGLVDDVEAVMARIMIVDTLADAVATADYIQESVFERVDIKREACMAIAAVMRPDAIVGSSSSGIPASAFTDGVPHRERFLIAHPVNPPHLIPLVELVPAPWTDQAVLAATRTLMAAVGQAPITVRREIEGFVLNRLQGALLNEAWALYDEGLASAADIDLTISDGLGLRWSFMGPFETIDLNAPGGVADYAERLGGLYHRIALDRCNPRPWSADLAQRIAEERRRALPLSDLAQHRSWRDRRLMALKAHKADQE